MLRECQCVITMQRTCSHMKLLMFCYKQNPFKIECRFEPLLTQTASLLLHYEAISQVAWMERPKNRPYTRKSKAAKQCQLLSDQYSMTVLVASGFSEKQTACMSKQTCLHLKLWIICFSKHCLYFLLLRCTFCVSSFLFLWQFTL